MNNSAEQKHFGQFSDDGLTFELNTPNTARPWHHCISNENYLLWLKHTGSGESFYRSPVGNQVTSPPGLTNNVGRFFYVRQKDTGKFFSPMVYPVHSNLSEYSKYQCSFTPGGMSWTVKWKNISSELSLLLCHEKDVELYLLKLSNDSNVSETVDCFFNLQWDFGGAPRKWGGIVDTYFEKETNAQIANLRIPQEYRLHQTGFITSNLPILDFDCDQLRFLGTLGNISRPEAVIQGECFNTIGPKNGEPICGSMRVQVELPPNKEKYILFAVGIAKDLDELKHIIPKYQKPEVFKQNKIKIQRLWQNYLSKQKICEPWNTATKFFDTWLKYQVVQNFRWGRWGHYRGFRDVLQDTAGMRLLDSGTARNRILEVFRYQQSNGNAMRQWSVVHWKDHDWSDYHDNCFWLIYAIEAYLRETGDFDILGTLCPFIDDEKEATVWEHLKRVIEFLWQNRGGHGLCLLADGDWLDSLNRAGLKGKGESVWLSQALCWALLKMSLIAEKTGCHSVSEKYQAYYGELKKAINSSGWDGNWYLRAYDDNGNVIGSSKNVDGPRIFLNCQSWAVIAQIADANQVKRAFESVEKLLVNQAGYLCYGPATYNEYDPNIGRISIGSSETDSVYVHAVTFKILADLMCGNADRAYETIEKITPAVRKLPAGVSGAEPFCYVNSFAGNGWPKPGWNTAGWFTGAATWMLQIIIEWFFGARAEYEGLKISPCLPSTWGKARLIRHIRNTSYDITITKPIGICTGKVELELDGKKVKGDILPYLSDDKCHSVHCVISKKV